MPNAWNNPIEPAARHFRLQVEHRQSCQLFFRQWQLAAFEQPGAADRKDFLAEQPVRLAVLEAAVTEGNRDVDIAAQGGHAAITGDQANVQLRISFAETWQARHQPVGGKGEVRGNLQHLVLVLRGHRGEAGIDRLQAKLDVLLQQLAGFGKRNATMDAVEQPHAQFLLQPFDLLTDRRLRSTQFRRRRGETQLAGGGLEHPQQVEGQVQAHLSHKHWLSEACLVMRFTLPITRQKIG